jgi:hypothetical protein
MGSNAFRVRNFIRKFFSRQNRYFNYVATAFELTLEALVLLVVTMGLSALLLSMLNTFWFTYRDTHVGLVFVKQVGSRYGFLAQILKEDIVRLSFDLTLSAFVICLIISTVCQFMYFGRFFQGLNGWLHKFMYWGIPLTVIVSAYFYRWPQYPVDRWSAAYILYFIPTLCVYGLCFKITNALLPEIGTVIKAPFKALRFILAQMGPHNEDALMPVAGLDRHGAPQGAETAASTKMHTPT